MHGNSNEDSSITPVGITDWRNIHKLFGIKDKDRLGHIYVIGKTGVGKSTLLENMAISDIEKGNGLALIDPHGDIAEHILHYIPSDRIKDVIYFNPADRDFPIGFNPIGAVQAEYRYLVASGLISTFRKHWSEFWGPRMEHVLKFSLLTLLEYPQATLLDLQPLLTDTHFRTMILNHVKNPDILSFWNNEFEKLAPKMKAEVISPILNKIGVFVTSLPLKHILGQKTSRFKFVQMLDEKKIFIANLSKGSLGEDVSSILGSMLLNSLYLAALYRAKQDPDSRTGFFLYVDEAHSFLTLSFTDMLSEARKYGLSVFMAHQYIEQLPEKIRAAVFGNVGTIISFRIGAADAKVLAEEFKPVFSESDLIHLPRYSMYLKLMIDGATSKPFSATTAPLKRFTHSNKDNAVEHSRKSNASKKEDVEATLKRTTSVQKEEKNLFN